MHGVSNKNNKRVNIMTNWKNLWVSAKVVTDYFRITHRDKNELREKLKGTPYLKKSDSRCGKNSGYYYFYDLTYLTEVLKLKPLQPVPKRLIQGN